MKRITRYAALAAVLGTFSFGASARGENLGFTADSAAPSPIMLYDVDAGDAPVSDAASSAVASDAGAVEEEAIDADAAILELRRQIETMREETSDLKARLDKAEKKPDGKGKTDKFTTKFGGQFKFDGAVVSQDDDARAGFGEARNSVGVRDIRVTASGSGYGRYQYSFGMSIHDHITLRHAYFRVKDTPLFGDITVGHFFVESGMESVQTNYERYFGTVDEDESFFRIGRRLGAASTIFGQDKRSRLFLGLFASASIESAPERLNGEHCGTILNARYTTLPIYVEDSEGFAREVLHLGGSCYIVDPASTAPLVSRTRGLGWTGTNPYFISGLEALNGSNYTVGAIEAAYQKEGFNIMGEGYLRSIDGRGNAYGATLTMLCMLTPNASRTYNKQDGRFGGIKMAEDQLFLDYCNRQVGRNWGAWEAVAKWEWTQANDVKDCECDISRAAPPIYGTVNRMVLGMNWFWNESMNWAFNWEHAFVDSHQMGKDLKGDFDTMLIQTSIKF